MKNLIDYIFKKIEMSRYIILISLIAIFFAVELIVGIYANSLSLQTDAFHMLSDMFALIIAYISIRLSKREKSIGYTYGWTRSEILGGFINGIALLSICFILVIELITKFIELVSSDFVNKDLGEQVDLVLIAAGIGLFINLIGLCMFHDHGHNHSHKEKAKDKGIPNLKDLEKADQEDQPVDDQIEQITINYNNHAVFLHVLGDTLGSIAVIINGLLVKFVESKYKFLADPLVSALIIVFITYSSFKLARSCYMILLHETPNFIDYDKLVFELKSINGVKDLHDIHIWSLTTVIIVASLHVKIHEKTLKGTDQIIRELKDVLHHHGVHVSTIQPEFGPECLEPECQEKCLEKQCCQ